MTPKIINNSGTPRIIQTRSSEHTPKEVNMFSASNANTTNLEPVKQLRPMPGFRKPVTPSKESKETAILKKITNISSNHTAKINTPGTAKNLNHSNLTRLSVQKKIVKKNILPQPLYSESSDLLSTLPTHLQLRIVDFLPLPFPLSKTSKRLYQLIFKHKILSVATSITDPDKIISLLKKTASENLTVEIESSISAKKLYRVTHLLCLHIGNGNYIVPSDSTSKINYDKARLAYLMTCKLNKNHIDIESRIERTGIDATLTLLARELAKKSNIIFEVTNYNISEVLKLAELFPHLINTIQFIPDSNLQQKSVDMLHRILEQR